MVLSSQEMYVLREISRISLVPLDRVKASLDILELRRGEVAARQFINSQHDICRTQERLSSMPTELDELDLQTEDGLSRAIHVGVHKALLESSTKSVASGTEKHRAFTASYVAALARGADQHHVLIARAILSKDVVKLISAFVDGSSPHTEKVFHAATGLRIRRMNSVDKEAALKNWAEWSPAQHDEYDAMTLAARLEVARVDAEHDAASKRREIDSVLATRRYDMGDGKELTAKELIDKCVAEGFTVLNEKKKGAVKVWSLENPLTGKGLELKLREEGGYAAIAIAQHLQAKPVTNVDEVSSSDTADQVVKEEATSMRM